jgi:hypothetical protein
MITIPGAAAKIDQACQTVMSWLSAGVAMQEAPWSKVKKLPALPASLPVFAIAGNQQFPLWVIRTPHRAVSNIINELYKGYR